MFDRHLYQPLIHVKSDFIEVKPVALNEGEKDFVEDLKNFCTTNSDFFKNFQILIKYCTAYNLVMPLLI